ncbi:hypothetical protein [Ferdinandcohnia sp. SAFN-114]|uniref:hypothetical protein n=1 Tax=Ferdinandcohnia sp. SAFN-114 TaxID=3387275 RepID=UPI003F817F8B
MKSHEYRNGRLIQTNKRFSQLKMKQKEWIGNLLRERYTENYLKNGKKPSKQERDKILYDVYDFICEKEIWIPMYEVERYYQSKISSYTKNIEKIYL